MSMNSVIFSIAEFESGQHLDSSQQTCPLKHLKSHIELLDVRFWGWGIGGFFLAFQNVACLRCRKFDQNKFFLVI